MQSMGQTAVSSLQKSQVRLTYIYTDTLSDQMFSFSEAQNLEIATSETVATNGGSDLIVTSLNDDFDVETYIDFGSQFDDESSFIVPWQDDLLIGGLFWDSIQIGQLDITATVGNRSAFVAKINRELKPLSAASLSSSSFVRIRDAVALANGNILVIGSTMEDLFLNENSIIDNFSGIFMLELNVDLEIVWQNFWAATDRIDDLKLSIINQELFVSANFQDTLFLESGTLATRRFNVLNSCLIKINNQFQATNHVFFKSTFNNDYVVDRTYEQDIEIIINFRGNLVVDDIELNGRPQSDQSTVCVIDAGLNVNNIESMSSTDGARVEAVSHIGLGLYVGSGRYEQWRSTSSISQDWLSQDISSAFPVFIPLAGNDYFIERIFHRNGHMQVAGIFRGNLASDDLMLENNELIYQPFILGLESRQIDQENNLVIIPNPVISSFSIKRISDETQYFIFNVLGKLVAQGQVNGQVNISHLTRGEYLIKVMDGDRAMHSKLLKL